MPRPGARKAAIPWCLAAPILFAASAGAQTVRGVVRDSASTEPVAGAVISIEDSSGKALARVVSDGQGRYHLPTAGGVRLHTVRIGFRPRFLTLRENPAATDFNLDLTLVALPQLLDRVVVTDVARCRGSPDQDVALGLWEQARAALLANEVARGDSAETRNVRFERALDPRSGEIRQQSTHRTSGRRISPFVAAYPASEFAMLGYMTEDSTGRTFNAPDADVLLDRGFAETHCFTVRRDAAHAEQVGLGFRPANDNDDIVDVSGTLWMDTERPALRSLDFSYTGLEPAATQARAGGFISFREMRPGVVFIDQWSIRLPILTLELRPSTRVPSSHRTRRGDMRLTGLHESGGELISAEWQDGIRWHNTLGRITGRVMESAPSRPVGGILVTLGLSSDSALTDSAGRFAFDNLVPGPYTLVANDTLNASFGLGERHEVTVRVQRDSASDIRFDWTPLRRRIEDFCRNEPLPVADSSKLGTVFGRVLLADGSPANGSVVGGFRGAFPFQHLPRNTFVSCNVERGRAIMLRAAHPLADTTDVHLQLADDEAIRRLDITLAPRGSTHTAQRGRLLGVFDAESGKPVPGAAVRDSVSGEEVATSSTGTVSLGFLNAVGPYYLVEVRKVGFRPIHLRLATADTTPITLVFEKRPLGVQELPTMVVVDHTNGATSFNGFEDRCQRSTVTCFRAEELARPNGYFADFLKKSSGVDVRCPKGPAECVALIHPDIAIGKCQPTYYVDGMKTPFTLAEVESFFKPDDIKGMEVYLAEHPKPLRFDPGPPCSGSVVIWTK